MKAPFIPSRTRMELSDPAGTGGRHAQMIRIALPLIGNGLSAEAVFAELRGKYDHTVADKEIAGVVKWASGKNPKPSGYGNGYHFNSPSPRPAKPVTAESAAIVVERFLRGFRCDEADLCHKAYGIGLNWGSLLRLSKVCLVARKYFGPAWPKRFKKIFLDGKKHFSFIEEMLWLSLWRGVTNVEYEARPFLAHGSRKGIDLRFDSCGQKINLEVKYRPKDWMRHVDGPAHNIVMPGYFYDVPAKFRFRNDGELNLVGLTALASIDRSLRERTQILLRENPNIDGVIIWAHASVDESPSFEIHSTKRPFIESLFAGADPEDLAHMGLVAHLWRKRDERRAFRADEVPRLLQQLAAQAQTFPPPR